MGKEGIRYGSSPDFCPPEVEGTIINFQDADGEIVGLEFLGILLFEGGSYGFFVIDGEDSDEQGELAILNVLDVDDEGIPLDFELVTDESLIARLYEQFKVSTKDLYRFC